MQFKSYNVYCFHTFSSVCFWDTTYCCFALTENTAAWSTLLSHGGESQWMTSPDSLVLESGFLQPLSYLDENSFHSYLRGKAWLA